ncbi:MAG: hypothetical protein KR126chlam5_01127 [Candidatus Anoxychlamydiales bacterium]|nr:hypothetical protein [Candidatus Anoxychlamydiales bacterium]
MKDIIEKIKTAICDLEKTNGNILVFALFLREGLFDKWDIIVAASWLDSKKMDDYKIISSEIQKVLNDSEFLQFSRIVILDQDDPVVSFLQNLKTIKNGSYQEFSGEVLSNQFGFTIKRAYLLRSQKIDKTSSN